MKSEPNNHHVRNQVIFIVLWSIAVVLWFSLPLMTSESLKGRAGTSVFIGWSVIGLFLVIFGVGTIRRLQLLAKGIPAEDKDPAFAKDFVKTRRFLTAKEESNLVKRLRESRASIRKSYQYPFDDLIAYLKKQNWWLGTRSQVEECGQTAETYFLHFRSPPSTWRGMCGRQGIYIVDAESLKALRFDIHIMN